MKTELKIGQILFAEDLSEYEITKIGNKYFECKDKWRSKFEIETLKNHDPIYSQHRFQLYTNKQDILDKKEHHLLIDKIRTFMKPYGYVDITLEQLREIAKIINL